jgi:hypothetical protein
MQEWIRVSFGGAMAAEMERVRESRSAEAQSRPAYKGKCRGGRSEPLEFGFLESRDSEEKRFEVLKFQEVQDSRIQ